MGKESDRIRFSTKLGLGAGALFISGVAMLGGGTYKSIENDNEIREAKAEITSDLSEEERAKRRTEIPDKDVLALLAIPPGMIMYFSGGLMGASAFMLRENENQRAKGHPPIW